MLVPPATTSRPVTPSDSADFSQGVARGLWVGGAGVVVVQHSKNDPTTASFTVAANTLLPVEAIRVYATGTTATLIVALY